MSSPGGVVGHGQGQLGKRKPLSNSPPPMFLDMVPGLFRAQGSERAPGVAKPVWAPVGAGFFMTVTDDGEENGYCVGRHMLSACEVS